MSSFVLQNNSSDSSADAVSFQRSLQSVSDFSLNGSTDRTSTVPNAKTEKASPSAPTRFDRLTLSGFDNNEQVIPTSLVSFRTSQNITTVSPRSLDDVSPEKSFGQDLFIDSVKSGDQLLQTSIQFPQSSNSFVVRKLR